MTIKQQQIATLREALGDELFECLEEETMDFPRAWEIARGVPMEEHDERCSYRVSRGGCLCDCYVITWHKEYKEEEE